VITVSRAFTSSIVVALVLGTGPAVARAEGIAFVHDTSIYMDAKEASLKAPEGVACTDAGYVVVADTGNQRLLVFSYKDYRLSGGTEVKLAQLTTPVRVQVDPKGNVLALDSKTRKIVKVSATGTFDGTFEPKGLDDAGKIVVGAFKIGPKGEVILLDLAGRRVLVLDASGSFQRQVEIPKEAGTVMDVTSDLGGTLYAVDAVNASVWSAEKDAKAFKALTPGMKDKMSFPTYITSSKGRLMVVDQNGNGVVILGVDGSYQGRQLSIGWSDGLVNYPAQLCLTEAGFAFLADRYNNRVQVFTTK
jgi:DNA-binding beta-propeller fold protein YncE